MKNILIQILSLTFLSSTSLSASYKLRILHNNDFHSKFAPTTLDGSPCDDDKRNDCVGGIARTVHLVEKFKSDPNQNVIFLNAGDFFQGSLWYTFYKHFVVSEFVTKMSLDAMSLGNHEFDDGVDGLEPFLKAAKEGNIPVLACNLDIRNEPRLSDLRKSQIIERNGVKIAIIGYLTPETRILSTAGSSVIFMDEVESIRSEIKSIKSQSSDVKIFIALGHSGYEEEKKIAEAIPDLDIIVGGHSHTFLWTGEKPPSNDEPRGEKPPSNDEPKREKPPSNDEPKGPYPTVISHSEGKKTLVLQAGSNGKYLGFLDVAFDTKGNVVQFEGNPIFINSSVPERTRNDLKSMVEKYKKEIRGKFNQVIGSSAVHLDSQFTSCRGGECSMGNLITDAYVDGFVKISRSQRYDGGWTKSQGYDGGWTKSQRYDGGWTKYPIAITSSGDIRSTEKGFRENISLADILSIIPFGNSIEVVKMSGIRLKEVFEHSVSTYDPKNGRFDGRFLQVSGIHVKFDVRRTPGDRVVSLKARCGSDCWTPKYEHVKFDHEIRYPVIATNYLINGGDGYEMVQSPDVIHEPFGTSDYDLLSEYIKKKSPITTGSEERITFLDHSSSSGSLVQKSIISTLIGLLITTMINY